MATTAPQPAPGAHAAPKPASARKRRGPAAATNEASAADHAPKRGKYAEKPARVLRREERRDLLSAAKAVWERLRPRSLADAKAHALAAELHALLQGRLHTLIFQHEGSRMVQHLLTHAPPATRGAIVAELHAAAVVATKAPSTTTPSGEPAAGAGDGEQQQQQPLVLRMAADRYARHLIAKLLRVAPQDAKQAFERQLLDAAPELLRNATAARTLDVALAAASPATRARVAVRSLLARAPGARGLAKDAAKAVPAGKRGAKGTGKSKAGEHAEEEEEKEGSEAATTLGDALAQLPREFRGAAAEHAGDVALALVEKGGDALALAATHAALAAWLRWAIAPAAEGSDDDADNQGNNQDAKQEQEQEQEQDEGRRQQAVRVRALGVAAAGDMVRLARGSRDGAFVAATLVKALDAKHRKAVVRALRGSVRDLAMHEHGHRVLLAALEFTDDTRLTGSTLLAELCFKQDGGAAGAATDGGAAKKDAKSGGDSGADNDGAKGGARMVKRGGRSRAVKKLEAEKEDEEEGEQVEGEEGGETKANAQGKKVEGERERKGGKRPRKRDSGGDTNVDVEFMCELAQSRFGRSVLLWILAGHDSRYFNPQEYGGLWEALPRAAFGVTSKKDGPVRRKELLVVVETALCELLRAKQEVLLPHVLGSGVIVASAAHATLREAIADGFAAACEGNDDDDEEEEEAEDGVGRVLESRAAQRATRALVKVGGQELAQMVRDKCGGEALLARLRKIEPMGRDLADGLEGSPTAAAAAAVRVQKKKQKKAAKGG